MGGREPRDGAVFGQLADPAGLDPGQAGEWASSLSRSLRVLAKFARQVKEVSTT